MTTYISLTDTADMIRKTLKIEFPGIKFSVKTRRFANGTACDIRWVDGPTSREVDDVVGFYSGSTFDPMIDLSSSKTHTNEGGEEIHYGAKYVTTRREYSNGFFQHMIDYATATYAFTEEPEFELVDGGKFEGFIKGNDNARFGNEWAVNFLMNLCYKTNANNLPVIPVKAAVEIVEAVAPVTVESVEVQPASKITKPAHLMTAREIYTEAYRALRVMEHQRPTQTYTDHIKARISARNRLIHLENTHLNATEAARDSIYLRDSVQSPFWKSMVANIEPNPFFQPVQYPQPAPIYAVGDTIRYMTISGNHRTIVVTERCPDTLRNEGFRGIDSRGYAVWGYDSDILSVTPAATR